MPQPTPAAPAPGRPRRRRRGLIAAGVTLALLVTGGVVVWQRQGAIGMTRPVNEWTFTHMDSILPTATVTRGGPVHELPAAAAPPELSYELDGETRSLDDLHRNTHSTSMVVLHRGEIVYEAYPGTFAGPERRNQLFSITKSVTSILVGVALEEGSIRSLDETVAEHVPFLADSEYGQVTLAQLLDMGSGVGGPETWSDPDALINRYEHAVTSGGDIRAIIAGAERTAPAGTRFNYSTIDTQVLGWALEGAVGMPLAEYASAKLWGSIGAESDGFYFLTRKAPQDALGGGSLNLTTRDLARVGLLMANGGELDGRRIVPEAWVERGRGSETAYLQPGKLGPEEDPDFGYANQWWPLGGESRAFAGRGVHGQLLYVDPEAEVVIAKTSAWADPSDDARDAETLAAARQIVEQLRAAG